MLTSTAVSSRGSSRGRPRVLRTPLFGTDWEDRRRLDLEPVESLVGAMRMFRYLLATHTPPSLHIKAGSRGYSNNKQPSFIRAGHTQHVPARVRSMTRLRSGLVSCCCSGISRCLPQMFQGPSMGISGRASDSPRIVLCRSLFFDYVSRKSFGGKMTGKQRARVVG